MAVMELPAEMIRADTPLEFRRMLARILDLADLTAGQVASKTKIPRSQCYALISESRTTLPTKSEQVKAFVVACGVGPLQTGLIMKLWESLGDRAISQKIDTAHASRDGREGTPTTADSDDAGPSDSANSNLGSDPFEGSTRVASDTHPPKFRSRAPWIELLYLVLDDPDRTDRARSLLLLAMPILLVVLLVIVGLVVFASFDPMRGGPLLAGAALAAPLSVIAARRRRR
jgi:hypothetical protein